MPTPHTNNLAHPDPPNEHGRNAIANYTRLLSGSTAHLRNLVDADKDADILEALDHLFDLIRSHETYIKTLAQHLDQARPDSTIANLDR